LSESACLRPTTLAQREIAVPLHAILGIALAFTMTDEQDLHGVGRGVTTGRARAKALAPGSGLG